MRADHILQESDKPDSVQERSSDKPESIQEKASDKLGTEMQQTSKQASIRLHISAFQRTPEQQTQCPGQISNHPIVYLPLVAALLDIGSVWQTLPKLAHAEASHANCHTVGPQQLSTWDTDCTPMDQQMLIGSSQLDRQPLCLCVCV